jgi:hypothetical protein
VTKTPTVHFIYHVPKCAGRTLEGHIAGAMPPSTVYRPQKPRGFSRLGARHYKDLVEPISIRVVEGHYVARSIEARFSNHLIKRSILLRDPVSHISTFATRSRWGCYAGYQRG